MDSLQPARLITFDYNQLGVILSPIYNPCVCFKFDLQINYLLTAPKLTYTSIIDLILYLLTPHIL